jgi:Co/Zn/Cd efflux system component
MAGVILVPALAAIWQAVNKAADPVAPDAALIAVTSGGAAVLNLGCALLLARTRQHGGSLGQAAFLSARNDVAVNLAVIAMAALTGWTGSGWPDIVLGLAIIALNGAAAIEVWRLATEEQLAARALSDTDLDD